MVAISIETAAQAEDRSHSDTHDWFLVSVGCSALLGSSLVPITAMQSRNPQTVV